MNYICSLELNLLYQSCKTGCRALSFPLIKSYQLDVHVHLLFLYWHFDHLKASQSGYAVDFATQGAQGGFHGNFLNQNSQAGYSRFGSGNDFMSQVVEDSSN